MSRFILAVAGFALTAAACDRGGSVAYEGPHASLVRRAIGPLERAAGRQFKTSPHLAERTRDEVRGFLERAFTEQISPLEMAGIEKAYKRFGMIADTLDLRALYINLLTEQVVGYYDPHTDTLYVVRGAPAEYLGITITHELAHALQDQHFALDSLERIRHSSDRRTASQAVVEGHAVWEQMVVSTGVANFYNLIPGGWDGFRRQIQDNQQTTPIMASAPTLLREALVFPYLSGANHIKEFKARVPGGWPFDSLPESTEQVLHAEKYFGRRDHPTTITLPAMRGGNVIYGNDLGEFETRLFLYEHSRDLGVSAQAAAGWDGDRFAVVALDADRDALVWVTVWDSAQDQAEFVDALETVLPRRYKGMSRIPGGVELRRFGGAGRSVEVRAAIHEGRPIVVLTDVPAGVATDLLSVGGLRFAPGGN